MTWPHVSLWTAEWTAGWLILTTDAKTLIPASFFRSEFQLQLSGKNNISCSVSVKICPPALSPGYHIWILLTFLSVNEALHLWLELESQGGVKKLNNAAVAISGQRNARLPVLAKNIQNPRRPRTYRRSVSTCLHVARCVNWEHFLITLMEKFIRSTFLKTHLLLQMIGAWTSFAGDGAAALSGACSGTRMWRMWL